MRRAWQVAQRCALQAQLQLQQQQAQAQLACLHTRSAGSSRPTSTPSLLSGLQGSSTAVESLCSSVGSSSSSSSNRSGRMGLGRHQLQQHRGFFDVQGMIARARWDLQDPARATTNILIAINVGMYLATLARPGLLPRLSQNAYALSQNGEYWRLLTAPFLHGGLGHVFMNMLGIHFLAPPVEAVCSRTVFLCIYMAGAVGGGLAHHLFGSPHTYVLGSSGAIAGLFAAFVMYKWRNRDSVGFTDMDKQWIMQMVGLNLMIAFAFSGTLAHMAHGGGVLGGAAAMFLVGPRYVRERGGYVDRPLIRLP